jgi:hypothetical protein
MWTSPTSVTVAMILCVLSLSCNWNTSKCRLPTSENVEQLDEACESNCIAVIGYPVDEERQCVDFNESNEIIIGCIPKVHERTLSTMCYEHDDGRHVYTTEGFKDLHDQGWTECTSEYSHTIELTCD